MLEHLFNFQSAQEATVLLELTAMIPAQLLSQVLFKLEESLHLNQFVTELMDTQVLTANLTMFALVSLEIDQERTAECPDLLQLPKLWSRFPTSLM